MHQILLKVHAGMRRMAVEIYNDKGYTAFLQFCDGGGWIDADEKSPGGGQPRTGL